MCSVRFTLTTYSRKAVARQLKTAQQQGRLRQVKSCLALLAVGDGRSLAEVAEVLRVHEKTVATWVQGFCGEGIHGAPRQQPTGRPPKLTPRQKPPSPPAWMRGRCRLGLAAPAGARPDPTADL